jgi:nitroreductase
MADAYTTNNEALMRSILKLLLSPHRLHQLKSAFAILDRRLVIFCSRHRLLAALYYCCLSRSFGREQQAVLAGRCAYWSALANPAHSSVMLRRNIHRLEKGMIMRPRRERFAEGYIAETVERFVQCIGGHSLNAGERQWAQQVLSEYFSIVGSSAVIDGARTRFMDAVAGDAETVNTSVPYPHQQIQRAEIGYDQFYQLCVQRRSVRWFEDKPVPRELLNQAIAAASLAPSACNRQPFEFYLFDQPEQARQLAAIPMGTAGFSHNFQCAVVVVGDLAAYPYERDRHVIYIDGSLAAMQFMLALETLGLSSCVINWPDIEGLELKMAKALNLSVQQRPIMVISVGYADGEGLIPFSQKKTAQELIKEVAL